MPNDRLRDALARNGLSLDRVAEELEVNAKTVERWITQGRTPYPKHRHAISALVQESESFLWPDAVPAARAAEISTSEIITTYPHRNVVPQDLWSRLFEKPTRQLDVLVYAALFLTENQKLPRLLRDKAKSGVKIRLLFGDPDSPEVSKRSTEEGIGPDTIGAKIRNVLAFFDSIRDEPGIEFRLHRTTLYNSVYRFDDEMLVSTHIYGRMAAHAPMLHLKQLPGGTLFDLYTESFDTIWSESKEIPSRSSVTTKE